jgi:hypothetical protein
MVWTDGAWIDDRQFAGAGDIIVAASIASLKGKPELHCLPGYAPGLNPGEFVWNSMRRNGASKTPLRKNASLQGPRRQCSCRQSSKPHSRPLVLYGAGTCWYAPISKAPVAGRGFRSKSSTTPA